MSFSEPSTLLNPLKPIPQAAAPATLPAMTQEDSQSVSLWHEQFNLKITTKNHVHSTMLLHDRAQLVTLRKESANTGGAGLKAGACISTAANISLFNTDSTTQHAYTNIQITSCHKNTESAASMCSKNELVQQMSVRHMQAQYKLKTTQCMQQCMQ